MSEIKTGAVAATAPEGIPQETATPPREAESEKFCKHCGAKIPKDAVICTSCGRQVEELAQKDAPQPSIVINNANTNTNTNTVTVATGALKKEKNKWVALLLCLFLGIFGAHKFYEGKIGMGILYIFTAGLFVVGILIDFIILLFKPNPYYV